MAVIQKIRNKYGKIAGGLIALSLVGFILMDAASGRFGDLFGHDSSIARVDGKKIEGRDFGDRESEYEALYTSYGRGRTIDDKTRLEIKAEALDNMVFEKAIDDQCEKLGLETTKDEEREIIYGSFPDPLVQQFPYFADQETNQFNPQYVKGFEQQAKGSKNPDVEKALSNWELIKQYVIRNNTYSKFNYAIMAAAYVPKFMIQKTIQDQGTKASIRFVKVPYISVSDNEVKITDQDVTDYMNRNPGRFKVPSEMRGMDYVSFDVLPSQDDTAKLMEKVMKAKAELAAAPDKEVENVVNRNSDNSYVEGYVNKRMFTGRFADSIMAQPVGTTYGPYMENSIYKITKVLDRKELPDTIKGNIILIAVSSQGKEVMPDSMAKRKIDSAAKAAQAGAPFAELAQKYSMDRYTNKDGKFTYSLEQKAVLPKKLSEYVFAAKAGDKQILMDSSDNFVAYFYVEVQEVRGIQPAVKLATISRELMPSQDTRDAAFSKANTFAGKNATASAFDEAIKKEGLNKKLAEGVKAGDFTIGAIGGNCRDIVRWLYDAKIGDVSAVFSVDNHFIVAKMSSTQDKGMLKLNDDLRPRIESIVKQEKKYKLIAEKNKSMGSLDAIAQSSNSHVQEADSFSMASGYVPNLGYEPQVMGYAFFPGLKANTVSPGIRGGDGVFFISVLNLWSDPIPQQTVAMLFNNQRMQQEGQQRQKINQQLRTAIIETAHVKYNTKNM